MSVAEVVLRLEYFSDFSTACGIVAPCAVKLFLQFFKHIGGDLIFSCGLQFRHQFGDQFAITVGKHVEQTLKV